MSTFQGLGEEGKDRPVTDGPEWLINILVGGEGDEPARFLEMVIECSRNPEGRAELMNAALDLWELWGEELVYGSRHRLVDVATTRCMHSLRKNGVTVIRGDRRAVRLSLERLMNLLLHDAKNETYSLPISRVILSRVRQRRQVAISQPARRDDDDHRRYEFIRRRVRTGKAFSTDHIMSTVGLSRKKAERRKHHGIFSDREVAALLGLSLEAMRSLMTPTASATAMNALAVYTGYFDPRLREAIDISKRWGFYAAAANKSELVTEGDVQRLNLSDHFAALRKKFDRLDELRREDDES